jgi:hypothetical protein
MDQNFESLIINFQEESESDTSDEEMIFSETLKENNYNIISFNHKCSKKLIIMLFILRFVYNVNIH